MRNFLFAFIFIAVGSQLGFLFEFAQDLFDDGLYSLYFSQDFSKILQDSHLPTYYGFLWAKSFVSSKVVWLKGLNYYSYLYLLIFLYRFNKRQDFKISVLAFSAIVLSAPCFIVMLNELRMYGILYVLSTILIIQSYEFLKDQRKLPLSFYCLLLLGGCLHIMFWVFSVCLMAALSFKLRLQKQGFSIIGLAAIYNGVFYFLPNKISYSKDVTSWVQSLDLSFWPIDLAQFYLQLDAPVFSVIYLLAFCALIYLGRNRIFYASLLFHMAIGLVASYVFLFHVRYFLFILPALFATVLFIDFQGTKRSAGIGCILTILSLHCVGAFYLFPAYQQKYFFTQYLKDCTKPVLVNADPKILSILKSRYSHCQINAMKQIYDLSFDDIREIYYYRSYTANEEVSLDLEAAGYQKLPTAAFPQIKNFFLLSKSASQ